MSKANITTNVRKIDRGVSVIDIGGEVNAQAEDELAAAYAEASKDGVTVCQIQSLARANDPIYEFGFRFMGGGAQQEQIWRHVLTQLAQHWSVEPAIEVRKLCVDNRLQWSKAKNVWHNAVIRTTVTAPARWTRKALGRNP